MSEISNLIYFESDNHKVVDTFREIFGGMYCETNEECESRLAELNPKIVELMRQSNNDQKNLEWLQPYPDLLNSAKYLLDFDELDSNYQLWLGDLHAYSDGFGDAEFTELENGYQIFTMNNQFTAAFVAEVLKLAGAKNISFKSSDDDWDE